MLRNNIYVYNKQIDWCILINILHLSIYPFKKSICDSVEHLTFFHYIQWQKILISLYQIVHARTQTAIQVPYFPCKTCNYSRVAYSIFRYGTSPVSHNMFCYSSCRICLKIRNGGIQDIFVKNLAACNLNEYELLIASPIHQLKQKKASFSKISNIWNHFINMKLVSPLWKQLLLAIGPECASRNVVFRMKLSLTPVILGSAL